MRRNDDYIISRMDMCLVKSMELLCCSPHRHNDSVVRLAIHLYEKGYGEEAILRKNIDVSNLTSEQKDRVVEGKCPYCEKPIKGWKPGSEWSATMRQMKIDPSTGHASNCSHKDIRL